MDGVWQRAEERRWFSVELKVPVALTPPEDVPLERRLQNVAVKNVLPPRLQGEHEGVHSVILTLLRPRCQENGECCVVGLHLPQLLHSGVVRFLRVCEWAAAAPADGPDWRR